MSTHRHQAAIDAARSGRPGSPASTSAIRAVVGRGATVGVAVVHAALALAMAACAGFFGVACGDADGGIDEAALREAVAEAGVAPLGPPPTAPPALVELGRALFFDAELSGNRDVACATCHAPELATSDFASMAIGTGGRGVGPNRVLPEGRRLYPRNTPDLFNRGFSEWTELGWDGKVRPRADGGWTEPEDWEDTQLPGSLSSALAAQAVVAISDRDQMTGRHGDLDVDGEPNELGGLEDEELPELWRRVTARLLAIDEYGPLFAAAYPDTNAEELDITHLAEALAAFESVAFVSTGSPFDTWIAGADDALTDAQKRGAQVFFGRGECAACHGGPHLTDHAYHALAVPQVGLGQEDEEPMDYGRGRETNTPEDRFRFRTPALRNVTETGPWMHDGAYTTLEAAVRHHLDCEGALRGYDPRQLKPELQFSFRDEPIELQRIIANMDPWCAERHGLSNRDVADLLEFLGALTDPDLGTLADRVRRTPPSGRTPR